MNSGMICPTKFWLGSVSAEYDIRIERLNHLGDGKWGGITYAETVDEARRMIRRYAMPGHPVRAIDENGIELMCHIDGRDTMSYAVGIGSTVSIGL